MFVLDVRIFGGDLVEDFMKQTVGQFHDVVFGEAGDFLAVVTAGVFESVANDLFRAGPRNQFQALHDLIRLTMLDARVKIFFVFTNDHDVHARMLCFDERMIRNARANVRVETERLAHGHVKTLEAATLRRRDRRFQKHFGAAQRIPRTWLDA